MNFYCAVRVLQVQGNACGEMRHGPLDVYNFRMSSLQWSQDNSAKLNPPLSLTTIQAHAISLLSDLEKNKALHNHLEVVVTPDGHNGPREWCLEVYTFLTW